MRSIPLFFVAVFLTAMQFAQAVPVDTKPADHTIEQGFAPSLASPLWSAKHTVAVVDQPAAASTPTKYGYSDAYAAFEKCGKLCVLIVTDNCPPCEQAKDWFSKVAQSRESGACIVLHEAKDAEAADIKQDNVGYPQLIVYHAPSGSDVDAGDQSRQVLVGYREIVASGEKLAFSRSRGEPKTVATNISYQKCSGGCDSCPADCSSNLCDCGSRAAHDAGSCGGGCGLVPGQPIRNTGKVLVGTARWFQEHKPVRKALKGTAVGVVRAGKVVAWCITHPCGGFFRNRCR